MLAHSLALMLCAAFTGAAPVSAQTDASARHEPARPAGDLIGLRRWRDRAARDGLVRRLRALPVRADFDAMGPIELARFLGAATGDTTFVVKDKAEIEPLTLEAGKIPMTALIDQVQRALEVRFVYHSPGVVVLSPRANAREARRTVMYDVRAATTVLPDRPGPELRLTRPGDEDEVWQDEDAEGTSISGFDTDKLIDLVTTYVLPDTWDVDGNSIQAVRGVLWVRQTEQGHAQVRRLLETLGVIPRPIRVNASRLPSPALRAAGRRATPSTKTPRSAEASPRRAPERGS